MSDQRFGKGGFPSDLPPSNSNGNDSLKLTCLGSRKCRTVVKVGDAQFGGTSIAIIAGPCAVESRDQLLSIAKAVKKIGAKVLRGGAFKPRTSPYSFQGLKAEGLKILADVGKEVALPVISEVISPADVGLVAGHVDILQIGARNMQNFALLEEVGRTRKPVLIKRGIMATVEELLLSAEYVLSRGNESVILCERGIRTFERYTRNTLDLSCIPLVKQLSHLPIIVDPSHSTGSSLLVPSMAKAAVAAGADGLMVEVHTNPNKALSDGFQSLNHDEFAELIENISKIAKAVGRTV